MPSLPRNFFAALAAVFVFQSSHAAETASPLTLFYTNAAVKWTEALPIGNGRLGAMIFGGVAREHLQLNEATLWAGGPYDPNNTNALAALPEARKLVFDGKYDEAAKLISDKMMAVPLREMPYETLGDLLLDFPTNDAPVETYRRDLDLDTAVASVSYTANGVHFKREIFSSPVDQVIVMRLTADKPGQISFTAGMTTPQKVEMSTEANTFTPFVGKTNDATLVMNGVNGDARGIKGALKFQARVRVLPDGGTIHADADKISVANADSVTLLIAAATSYKNYHDVSGNPEAIVKNQIEGAYAKWANANIRDGRDTTLADHIAAHQKLFRRVALDLGETDAMKLPTDERIAHFAEGNDPQLAALYFQFARYLLISCSRPGGQPATLQGLWNDSMTPPWDSKYTININTEMNYWPAETRQSRRMRRAAHANGFGNGRHRRAHGEGDVWRARLGGASQHGFVARDRAGGRPEFRHVADGRRVAAARICGSIISSPGTRNILKKIYPAMKGAAQFFLDTLVEEPTHHWLVTCPSLSPENRNPAAAKTSITAGPTMDMEILRDLFANCIRASEILGTDKKFAAQLAAARARLAPLQIGSSGQLQEWLQDIGPAIARAASPPRLASLRAFSERAD